MKKILLIGSFLTSTLFSFAQEKVLSTKAGKVSFKCVSKVETIEAVNGQASCKLASKSGQITVLMLIKGFKFENSTMEEHFNENYMETAKFPKADFKGNITNISVIDFTKDGSYIANIDGTLTIHGVAKKVSEKATIMVKAGKVSIDGKLKIKLTDFGIKGEYIGSTISNDCTLNVTCKLD